jgi:DNA polymerase III delta prime subunit
MSTILFEHKYKPLTMDEMIVSPEMKKKLTKAIKELPNMILVGPPGVGKGTFVDILRRETNIECLKINCSDETGIDNIRDKVKDFSTTLGFSGIKLVYLNECDFLSPNAQGLLRDLMESVQKVTRFVLCCNYGHKVIDELYDRCQTFELNNPSAKEVVKRCWMILDKEGIKYDKAVVVEMVKMIWSKGASVRKALVTLRQNIVDGELSSNITVGSSNKVYGDIVEAMKSGNPDSLRTLLKSHQIEYTGLYRYLYDTLMGDEDVFKKDAQAIIHIGEHCYRDSIVAIKEINFMHMYFKMISDGTV